MLIASNGKQKREMPARAIPYLTRIVSSLEYIGRSQLYSPLSPLSSAFFASLVPRLSPSKYCFGDCTARSIHSVLKHARIMLPEWDEEHDGDVDEDDWKKRNERGEDWAGLPGPSLQRGSIERTSSYASSMAAQGATSERTGEGWNDEKSIFPRTKTTIYQRASSNAYLSLIAAVPGRHPSTSLLLHDL